MSAIMATRAAGMLRNATETPIAHIAKIAAIEYKTKIHLISFIENPP